MAFKIVLLCFVLQFVDGRIKAPLIDEDVARVRNRAAECVFGKEVKELGSQWIPDLGAPIGVLYCMRCECARLQRKNRNVARVQCRNIKHECPPVTCDEPVLKKGQCCKMCPDTITNPNEGLDVISRVAQEEEEKSNKYFSALLSGRSSQELNDPTQLDTYSSNGNMAATGRFVFTKKNLHYSFYYSQNASRPKQVQFRDESGTILEEFNLGHNSNNRMDQQMQSLYQNETRKVCGVWKRLPRDYRRMLKQGHMYVHLIWTNELLNKQNTNNYQQQSISGQILKYQALQSETFSSLLEPDLQYAEDGHKMTDSADNPVDLLQGSAGTAIVSISTTVPSSLHLTVIFNGMFKPEDTHKVPVRITLTVQDKLDVFSEVIVIEKPAKKLNTIELSTNLELPHLRSLTRGKLEVKITSENNRQLQLKGTILTKVQCELFQTILTSNLQPHQLKQLDFNNMDSKSMQLNTVGLAWLYLTNHGSMHYNINIHNLQNLQNYALTMSDVSTKRKTELEDFSPVFKNNWANGTLDKLSLKYLEPLYGGNMQIALQKTIDSASTETVIKGKLISKFVDESRDSSRPYLMTSSHYGNIMTGLSWLSIDSDCTLHYDITMATSQGMVANPKSANSKYDLVLEMLPMLAPGAPTITKLLETFDGLQAEGSMIETLNSEEVQRLTNGVSFLKLYDFHTKQLMLSTVVDSLQVPQECRFYNNNIPLTYNGDPVALPSPPGTCFYEGKFYEEEKQWISSENNCKSCFCQNGVANCDTMRCPPITCSGLLHKMADECCPICLSNSTQGTDLLSNNQSSIGQKCTLNGRYYSPGSKFHPFLIPTGFDTCTECFCDKTTLDIKCYRLNEKKCCTNCTDAQYNVQSDVEPTERKELPDFERILQNGGCRNPREPHHPYHNNATYHPIIDSLGEYKCVTCTCKNGSQECKREVCDLKACRRRKKGLKMGNTSNTNACCTQKECAKFKHRRNRH